MVLEPFITLSFHEAFKRECNPSLVKSGVGTNGTFLTRRFECHRYLSDGENLSEYYLIQVMSVCHIREKIRTAP